MNRRILLLDAGNTRLKWAVLDTTLIQPGLLESGLSESALWLEQGAAHYDELSALPALWQKWGTLASCYGVNVAGDSAGTSIGQALANIGLAPVWLEARARTRDVENLYRPPERLGADRWAALLAVRQRTPAAALIVSAGSALTVDALNADGQFLGGIIVPGLHLMRQALAHSTAQVGAQYGEVLTFPNTTADAVETGLVAACTGAIETMLRRLEKICGVPPRLFLTGGDANILIPYLPPAFSLVSGLVLEGVYYMTLEEKPT